MRLAIRHTTRYRFTEPVKHGLQRLRLTPKETQGQRIVEWTMEYEGAREELSYDDQFVKSLTLRPGIYGSYAFSTSWGVVIPQMTLEYVHEFFDDQRNVQFSFAQDPQNRRFLFQTTPPDRDYLNLGLGVSMVLPQGIQPYLNFRDMLAYQDRSTYTVTLGVRIPF